eukprot:4882601-Pleurochrysis_carterae.AAC.4
MKYMKVICESSIFPTLHTFVGNCFAIRVERDPDLHSRNWVCENIFIKKALAPDGRWRPAGTASSQGSGGQQ